MAITNIFVSPLAWPLTRKCSLRFAVFEQIWYLFERLGLSVQNKIVIRSNDLGYPFEKSCHLFKLLGLSVWKKLSSVRRAWDIRLKKLLSVQTARAICSKKNLSTVRATEAICSKINFSRVSIPKPFRRQPLTSNDLLFSRSRTLWILFTNVSYMNSYASLLLCSHRRFHIINRLSTVSTYVLVNN